MGLVTFAFNTPTYCQYNGKVYKRLRGTALASQVSVVVVVSGTLIQNTKKLALIFLFPQVTLPRGTKSVTTFHALVFTITFKHRKPTHTNRLLYKSSASVLPDFTQYTKSRLHAIVLQHKFYEHFPMRLFDVTVCSYLKFSKLVT